MKHYHLFLFLIIFSIACKNNKTTTSSPEKAQEEIKAREEFHSHEAIAFEDTLNLTLQHPFINDIRFNDIIIKEMVQFYKQNGYNTRWLYAERHVELFDSYLRMLYDSRNYGLNPETYAYSTLIKTEEDLYNKAEISNAEIVELDKQITASFLLFTKHLVQGRVVDPSFEKKIWKIDSLTVNSVELLLKLSDEENLYNLIASLQPQTEQYKKLKNKLSQLLKENSDNIAPIIIEDAKKFKVGYTDSNIVILREKIQAFGYDFKNDSALNVVDSNLIKALMQFQDDRGLNIDGVPGKNTLKYLNMSKDDVIDIIVLNMERMRWLNKDFGNEYIIVNIPAYKLNYFKNDSIIFSCKVIVGKEYNSTPIFMDYMEYLDFRPTWTVPSSIMTKEFIPKLRSNPNYYANRGFTLYENGVAISPSAVNWYNIAGRNLKFVEKPSEKNSLGLVKFIFPNNMNIYLHDTPTDYLFDRNERAFSHGCVRIEKPAELAYTVLQSNNKPWTMDEINEAMHTGDKPKRVLLDHELLVQLVYLTAYIDKNDKLIIRNDVYGHDTNQLKIIRDNYGIKYAMPLKKVS
ncbi:MAG: L,D-transpeptidase family protein [Bacteroidetes bacterium]|nr:L,D-transpeptidase family protein [Bacteroidota bacterium]MCB9227833.1 L,D-transpeptidase family protein [Chitinophagales bacterium]